MDIHVEKKERSQVEIKAAIPAETLESYRQQTIQAIQKDFEMPGFRKGHVPENILVANVSEMTILQEMAERAIQDSYEKILEEKKIDAIGRPMVMITKLAKGSPLEFKITTAVMPEVELPDYAKIAQKINAEEKEDVSVTDEDVSKVIEDLRKVRAKENAGADGEKEPSAENLPEVTDEFAQSFGPFKTVADLKAKIRENLSLEKENAAKEKRRLKIVEAIIEKAKIDVPQILIDAELDKMVFRLKEDIKQVGMTFEGYLEHLNKTEDVLRTEWTADAEKRSKLDLVIFTIAKKESVSPAPEDIEKEVANLLEHYKGADPERARAHVENVLTNEKVFQFLESQK